MLGFLIGFLCMVGLFKVLKGGRHGACGGRWAHHHHHHHHRRGRRGRGRGWRRGPWRKLDFLFERLDTSPGQEKEIRAAIRELVDEAYGMKGELREAQTATSQAFGVDHFDQTPLDNLFSAQDEKIGRLRDALKRAMERIHEALDEEQRAELASWLHRWSGRGFDGGAVFSGPYR